jgi:hypothetical protein
MSGIGMAFLCGASKGLSDSIADDDVNQGRYFEAMDEYDSGAQDESNCMDAADALLAKGLEPDSTPPPQPANYLTSRRIAGR